MRVFKINYVVALIVLVFTAINISGQENTDRRPPKEKWDYVIIQATVEAIDIATLLPVPIAVIQYDNFGIVIWMVVCILIIQLVIGNVVEPKVVGRRINLSPLVLLFSLALWGYIWGIVGMFLAVPLMVMIRIIFENIDGLRFISVYMGAEVKEN